MLRAVYIDNDFSTVFFRMPPRTPVMDINKIIAPSDGKVVIIEKVHEPEYFNDERIQVSIFMSPLNVHAQWYPIKGKVKYYKYHPGKYLVAWHPKSSTLNERSTLVLENEKGIEILVRTVQMKSYSEYAAFLGISTRRQKKLANRLSTSCSM